MDIYYKNKVGHLIFYKYFDLFSASKELIQPVQCPACLVDGDVLLPNEIDSGNFQQMLDIGFSETSKKFSSLKSVHFKKAVPQSSFLSKVLSFLLKSKQSQQK